MAHMLKLYLVPIGIGAFIALAFPAIVVIGLFLIMPGLILALQRDFPDQAPGSAPICCRRPIMSGCPNSSMICPLTQR